MTTTLSTRTPFRDWLRSAHPKDRYQYHTGYWLPDRLNLTELRQAYNRGEVTFVQKRGRSGDLAYLAVKLGRARIPSILFPTI